MTEELLDFPYLIDVLEEVSKTWIAVCNNSWNWILEEFYHLRYDQIIIFILKFRFHFITILPNQMKACIPNFRTWTLQEIDCSLYIKIVFIYLLHFLCNLWSQGNGCILISPICSILYQFLKAGLEMLDGLFALDDLWKSLECWYELLLCLVILVV